VYVDLKLDLRLCVVVNHSSPRTCAATKNPRPAESVAVRGAKLQSKGLGFGAHCMMPLGFMHLHAPKPMARGVAIEACDPIPQVLWLLSSKESNNQSNP
jgi:hypothetical protein